MKKVLLSLAAVATLAACSTEKTMDFAKDAIAFDNAFVDNATKSVSDPSYNNDKLFGDFAVFGFVEGAVLFDGTKVTGSALNGAWSYTGTQYWIAGANYNFAAVAPMTDGGWQKNTSTVNMTEGESKYTVTTNLSFTNNGTTDLLYADAGKIMGLATGNEKVAFTFRHILSKVKFSFENAYNASAATIKVYDIKITNAYKTGNVALTSASTSWTPADPTLVLDFGMATDDQATTEAKENAEVAYTYGNTYESQKELLLIPGAVTDGYDVTFNVDLLVSDQLIKTYEHTAKVNFAPAPGTCYDIKAVVNAENIDPEQEQEAIEFTVTAIDGWANPADGNDADKDPDQPTAEIQ